MTQLLAGLGRSVGSAKLYAATDRVARTNLSEDATMAPSGRIMSIFGLLLALGLRLRRLPKRVEYQPSDTRAHLRLKSIGLRVLSTRRIVSSLFPHELDSTVKTAVGGSTYRDFFCGFSG